MAFAPKLSIKRALPASQALGSMSRPGPSCRARNSLPLMIISFGSPPRACIGDHLRPATAVEIFSGLTAKRGLLEGCRRPAIGLAESRGEMTVAGKPQSRGQSGQIVVLRDQVQRSRQTQP